MFISEITNADAIPSLAKTLRFAGQRQTLIAHNIANISTPDFRPVDVSTDGFRKVLGDAIDRRRARHDGVRGELDWRETRELRRGRDGEMRLAPQPAGRNILFHDKNDRDLERQLQDLVENSAVHRMAADLLKSRFDLLRTAISERV